MKLRQLALPTLLLALCPVAHAEMRLEKALPLTVAQDLARAGVDACAAKGYAVTVAVVDRGGQMRALLRADGAGPHTLDSARKKAYTAASMKRATSAVLDTVQKVPASQYLWMIDNVMPLAGGLPIQGGGEVVGGIGIGGAPAGALDEECAQAALDKLADALK